MTLTNKQEEEILNLFNEDPFIGSITKKMFGEEKDGRSKEGRAIRSFLTAQNLEFDTSVSRSRIYEELSEDQKRILLSDEVTTFMSPLDAAKLVYKDDDIVSLSKKHIVVVDFLKEFRSEIVERTVSETDVNAWYPPRSMVTCLRKVNKWCHEGLGDNVDQLSSRYRKCIERLLKYLQGYKLITTINSFEDSKDRDLFESEFVRATWDKPDLTSDELNLYMMIGSNQVRVRYLQRRLDKLNRNLQNLDLEGGDNEPTMRLVEYIKSTSDELNQTEKRIESLVVRLNGDRAKRIAQSREANENFLYIVEEFQQKESRDRLILMAEMQNKLIAEEANRLEGMNEMKARIFGISKEELL